MSASDAVMWCIEKDPALRSTITTMTVLDRAPDRDRLTRRLDHVVGVIPRLRQRVVGHAYSIAPPRWENDPYFDLSFHVRWLRAPTDGSLRDVLDIAEPIAMQGFDRARPLWEAVIVEGLAGGRAAVIQKIHHAITDGVGGIRLQMALLDLERDADEEPTEGDAPDSSAAPLGEVGRAVDALTYELQQALRSLSGTLVGSMRTLRSGATDPIGLLRRGTDLASSTARLLRPVTHPLSPVMTGRSLSVHFETATYDLEATKTAAHVVGGSSTTPSWPASPAPSGGTTSTTAHGSTGSA
ncbi:MAG: wax ester/triacylglycerol synthase family O-acyltransferase [Acidimicrobiia bacterium]|nr:wax ester/triacylglycerol synthase family O-acyltransferase [Acidimicrobiia bacterium]